MAKRQLFLEAIPCILQILEVEENGQKLMKVRGVFHRADERNANNRIYPSKLLERETKRLNDRLKESVFMQADHPADGMSKVSQTAAILSSVEYDPRTKEVIGEAKILETSLGKDLAAIVRAGGHVGISARGFGTTTSGECAGQKGDVVNEDYQLATFDFVVGQSTRGAIVSSFSEQDQALAGLSGGDEMDISKMTLDELKAARPDLFKAIEEAAAKAAKAANEQDVAVRVATMVEEATEKIETKLRAELKLEGKKARKDMTAAEKKAADAEDAADKGDDETTEQYQARMAPKLEKAGLHIVKKDAAGGVSAKVEAEMTSVRTQLTEALQSLQQIGNRQKALDEQAQAIAVDKKIMEATKDEKKFRNALIERLRKSCTTIEEVDAKLPQERQAIERLLSETTGGHGKGAASKNEELGTDDGEEKTFKTKSGLVLTEQQMRERELSGMTTVLMD
jgi:hypothetical protein